jgi:hypothetical protein
VIRTSLFLSAALLSACSKKSGDAPAGSAGSAAGSAAPPSAPAAPAADPAAPKEITNQDLIDKYGSCDVTFEGDVQKTFRSPGGVSALGSDYFMNDAELRKALEMFAGPGKVEEAMKKDPKIYTLIVNCGVDELGLSFGAGTDSTYADIPFGPKKYEVGNGKGQIAMLATLRGNDKRLRPGPGSTFEITRFDGTGLVATFDINLSSDLKGKLRGKIDLRCAHDTSVCVAARAK